MEAVKSFFGLNNISDPLRLGLGWLTHADNVNITDTGALVKRDGYSRVLSGGLTDAYSTEDYSRMYVVANGWLKVMQGGETALSLKALESTAPMYWTEINSDVYFSNGTDSGIIKPDNTLLNWAWTAPAAPVISSSTGDLAAGTYRICCTFTLPDGRETGASEDIEITLTDGQALQVSNIELRTGHITNTYIASADSTVFQRAFSSIGSTAFVWNNSPDNLGVELVNTRHDGLPQGANIIQAWKGRMYAAQYLPSQDQSVVWFSQPLGFHLFDLSMDFFLVQGKVTMLAPHELALIVGTDKHIHAYDGSAITKLADYGVVAGQHWSKDDNRILFWSNRGLCAALPFINLTEQQVSVAPGVRACGTVVRSGGQKRFVTVLQQGGSPFNSL